VLLDAEFTRDPFPNREGRRRIAQLIGVPEKSIMVWHFDLYFLKQLPEIKFLLDCISGGFRIAVVVHANLDLQSRHQLVKFCVSFDSKVFCYIFRYLRLTSSPSYSWILFGPSGNFISGTNQLLDVRALFDVATSIRMGCSQLPTGGH
jgi:hypothetical protein